MRRQRSKTHPAASQPRTDRHFDEHGNDAYGLKGKLPDPTACPSCGATYREGRWTWSPAPADAPQTRCPACRRIADGYPAGILTVSGSFAAEHASEIEGLARNLEEREKREHPLKRIMELRPEGDGLVITTTDAKLARGIGEALHHAWHGDLDYHFTDSENVLRVSWTR